METSLHWIQNDDQRVSLVPHDMRISGALPIEHAIQHDSLRAFKFFIQQATQGKSTGFRYMQQVLTRGAMKILRYILRKNPRRNFMPWVKYVEDIQKHIETHRTDLSREFVELTRGIRRHGDEMIKMMMDAGVY